MGNLLSKVMEGVTGAMAPDPNNPFSAPPPSFMEYPLAFIGGLGQHPRAGPVTRGLSGLSAFTGQEMARRRTDPLGRILPVAEQVNTALQNAQLPGQTIQIGGNVPSIAPPRLFEGRPPTEFPEEPPQFDLPGRKATSIAEARPLLTGQQQRGLSALEILYPKAVEENRLFTDPIREQQRQLNQYALQKAPIELQAAKEKIDEVDREKAFFGEASQLNPSGKDYTKALIALQIKHKLGSGKDVVNQFLNLTSKESLAEYRTQIADIRERIADAREAQAETKKPISLESYRSLADQAAVTGDAVEAKVQLPTGEVVQMSNRTPGGATPLPRIANEAAIKNILTSVVRNKEFASLSEDAKRQALEAAANQAGHTFRSGDQWVVDPLTGYGPTTMKSLNLANPTFDIKTAFPLPLQRQPKQKPTSPPIFSPNPAFSTKNTSQPKRTWEEIKKMKKLSQ